MPDPFHDVYQTLGEHGAQLVGLKGTCDELKDTCFAISQKLDTLIADKHRGEGSRTVLYAIAAGVSTAAGAVAAAVTTWFRH